MTHTVKAVHPTPEVWSGGDGSQMHTWTLTVEPDPGKEVVAYRPASGNAPQPGDVMELIPSGDRLKAKKVKQAAPLSEQSEDAYAYRKHPDEQRRISRAHSQHMALILARTQVAAGQLSEVDFPLIQKMANLFDNDVNATSGSTTTPPEEAPASKAAPAGDGGAGASENGARRVTEAQVERLLKPAMVKAIEEGRWDVAGFEKLLQGYGVTKLHELPMSNKDAVLTAIQGSNLYVSDVPADTTGFEPQPAVKDDSIPF